MFLALCRVFYLSRMQMNSIIIPSLECAKQSLIISRMVYVLLKFHPTENGNGRGEHGNSKELTAHCVLVALRDTCKIL